MASLVFWQIRLPGMSVEEDFRKFYYSMSKGLVVYFSFGASFGKLVTFFNYNFYYSCCTWVMMDDFAVCFSGSAQHQAVVCLQRD
jgi:hypothetical protein